MNTLKILAALPVSLLATAVIAQETFIESCDSLSHFDAAPERVITLYQQTTELMLALGLEDRVIATAYLEDEIPAQWQDAYDTIPTHHERLPAREVVLASEPDFLISGFSSAFNDTNLGAETEWHEIGIGTYLVNAECRNQHPADMRMTTAPLFVDIERVGALFGVEDRAEVVAGDIAARLDRALEDAPGEGLTAFLFDSGSDTPYSAGCCGAPALLMESVGLTNITADIEGRWANAAWEVVVVADPDVIVLNDAGWSTAEEKRDYMENDPVLSQLTAVREGRFISVPFSETLLGMRFVDGVERLASGLADLDFGN